MTGKLEELGPIGFQDLAAALTTVTLGPGVQVMGPGRDGGRDMYYRGPLSWGEGEVWDGYTVFQVKHKRTISDRPQENASWLWSQIRKELDSWADGEAGREEVPDFFVVITNVPLSPTPDSGGHDLILTQMQAYIDSFASNVRDATDLGASDRARRHQRLSKITRWRVWDRHQVEALLNGQLGVRAAFPAFLTAGDVFEYIATSPQWSTLKDAEPVLRGHARASLTSEGLIYFDEAGSAEGGGLPIHQVAIDLPISYGPASSRSSTMQYVLERAEHMLKPGLTSFKGPRHLVLTGAPGNGKTTLSRFIVQVFRAALLSEAQNLSTDQRTSIDGVSRALSRMSATLPQNRRWPMRIDLADYAEQGGLDHESYLLRWIAQKISDRTMQEISPASLFSWLQRWPSILVLDGLDEVTEPRLRQTLLSQVTEFVNEAEAEAFDCLVVLTTRPVGYTEEVAPNHFERIDMDYMSLTQARHYGELVSTVRLHRDPERLERVIRRYREATNDEGLHNLLRTPLQVLILTVIIENAGSLAPDRYSLFWSYYDTVVKRERSKAGTTRHLLVDHAQHIERLHERVGLRLQILSEAAERSVALLSRQELLDEIWVVLSDAGFSPSGADSALRDKFFTAATQRLVLLTPRETGYGFDVRSLQELMAARCLTTGTAEAIQTRFRQIAPSPHWRNTFLFGAGRIVAQPQAHEHQRLVDLIETLDRDAPSRLGAVAPVAPQIALEVLDDGMLRAYPRLRRQLAATALRVLTLAQTPELPSIMRMLARYADIGDAEHKQVSEALRHYSSFSWVSAETVNVVRQLMPAAVDLVNAKPSLRGLRLDNLDGLPSGDFTNARDEAWEMFHLEVETASYSSAESAVLVQRAAATLIDLRFGQQVDYVETAPVLDALLAPECARIIEAALSAVIDADKEVAREVRTKLLPTIYRYPVGDRVEDALMSPAPDNN